jgi:hypothetical protein
LDHLLATSTPESNKKSRSKLIAPAFLQDDQIRAGRPPLRRCPNRPA